MPNESKSIRHRSFILQNFINNCSAISTALILFILQTLSKTLPRRRRLSFIWDKKIITTKQNVNCEFWVSFGEYNSQKTETRDF